MPDPSEHDDARAHDVTKQVKERTAYSRYTNRLVEEDKWNYGPKPIVMNNILYTGYPRDKLHLVEGKVEDRLPYMEEQLPS